MSNIKTDKKEALSTKEAYIQYLKDEEEANRRKILETRNTHKRNINKSYNMIASGNHQAGLEIRH